MKKKQKDAKLINDINLIIDALNHMYSNNKVLNDDILNHFLAILKNVKKGIRKLEKELNSGTIQI